MTRASAPISVFGTTFQNPILLAAGTAGFGVEIADVITLDRLGGLVTKAVSPEPRSGHPAPRVAEFAGGMLNAVGLANPGVEHVASLSLPWLAQNLNRARVLVNVVGSSVEEFVTVVRRLDASPIVTAFELNVSCPNTEQGNQEFAADPMVLTDLVTRCCSATNKPVIVKLAPNLPDLAATTMAVAAAGASGFSLVNTMPGALFSTDGPEAFVGSRLGFGSGGMSGPALLAIGVRAVQEVRRRSALPVIGVGGVRTIDDVRQYLSAGASLVAVGTAALADPRLPERLVSAWEAGG